MWIFTQFKFNFILVNQILCVMYTTINNILPSVVVLLLYCYSYRLVGSWIVSRNFGQYYLGIKMTFVILPLLPFYSTRTIKGACWIGKPRIEKKRTKTSVNTNGCDKKNIYWYIIFLVQKNFCTGNSLKYSLI